MNSKITEVFYVVLRSSTVLVEGVSDIDIPFFFDKTMHSEPVPMFVDARNCMKTLRPSGVVFPYNFSFSTRVDITVYQHGKCFIFVKYNITNLTGNHNSFRPITVIPKRKRTSTVLHKHTHTHIDTNICIP
jgi:hypothetical protein